MNCNLVNEMEQTGNKQVVAEMVGVSAEELQTKNFSINEMYKIKSVFPNLTYDYLFAAENVGGQK